MRAIPQRQPLFLGGSIGGVPSFDLNFARGDNPVTKYGFSFTRATSATYVNASGLIATAASGELRYTYDPVTLSALGVLIEEARTNSAPRNDDPTNVTYWTTVRTSASKNAATGPDGSASAGKILETAVTNTFHIDCATQPVTSGVAYCWSVFLCAGLGRNFAGLDIVGVGGVSPYVYINLTTGAVTAQGGNTGYGVVQYPGGWWRVWVTATTVSTASASARVYIGNTGTNQESYAGNVSKGVYFWGLQQEIGAFVTTPISTSGAISATRNADVLSLTGAAGRTNLVTGSAAPSTQTITVANSTQYTLSQTGSGTITLSGASTSGPLVGAGSLTFTTGSTSLTLTMSGSPANVQLETGASATTYIPTTNGPRTVENVASWFNGDAGTIVATFAQPSGVANAGIVTFDANTAAQRIQPFVSNTAFTQMTVSKDGASVAVLTTTSYAAGTTVKLAGAYAVDDYALSTNASAVNTDTSGALPYGIYRVVIGQRASGEALNSTISRIRYYNRRLPNATLQSLTA